MPCAFSPRDTCGHNVLSLEMMDVMRAIKAGKFQPDYILVYSAPADDISVSVSLQFTFLRP